MTEKMGPNIFQSLFKMSYQPCYVDNKKDFKNEKNHYPTIYSAISSANYNSLIKINEGLYVQKIDIKVPNIKIQSSQPTTNAIIANQQFPSIIIQLPLPEDKISFEGLKFAHVCEHNFNMYKPPSLAQLKQKSYRGYQVGINMNTCILIKRGTVYLDQCRLSLSAQKDPNKLIPSIVVEKQGTLIMSRCQIRGNVGSIGVVVKGGKVVIRQSNFKQGAIGILAVGGRNTSIIVKNSIFYQCIQGIVLAGPFQGTIQSNIITQSDQNGFNVLSGNRCKILSNQVKQSKIGIRLQNCSPTLMKNTITKCTQYGIQSYATKNIQCWALIKFNFINQNQKGGIYLNGYKNKTQIFNNQLDYNNTVGILIQKSASPHLLLNHIKNTLGVGLKIQTNSTAFVQKNIIVGSLSCGVVIEGPNNIGNYLYNNIIAESRADGLFVMNSEKFLIANNRIRKNHNGVLVVTSVAIMEENLIEKNKQNGVLMVEDNYIQFMQNQIFDNKKAGLAIRNSSSGQIKRNTFGNNGIQILVQNDDHMIRNIDQDNNFVSNNQNSNKQKSCDIRIPKNYSCEIM